MKRPRAVVCLLGALCYGLVAGLCAWACGGSGDDALLVGGLVALIGAAVTAVNLRPT